MLNWYKDGEQIFLMDFEEAFVKHMNWPARFARPYFVRSSQDIIDRFSAWTVKGMTVSAPGFYGPQGRSVRLALTVPDLIEKLESFLALPWEKRREMGLAGRAKVEREFDRKLVMSKYLREIRKACHEL